MCEEKVNPEEIIERLEACKVSAPDDHPVHPAVCDVAVVSIKKLAEVVDDWHRRYVAASAKLDKLAINLDAQSWALADEQDFVNALIKQTTAAGIRQARDVMTDVFIDTKPEASYAEGQKEGPSTGKAQKASVLFCPDVQFEPIHDKCPKCSGAQVEAYVHGLLRKTICLECGHELEGLQGEMPYPNQPVMGAGPAEETS